MKYRVHRFNIKMTSDQSKLEQFLNSLEGEVVAIIPNVTWVPKTQVDFLLIVEKLDCCYAVGPPKSRPVMCSSTGKKYVATVNCELHLPVRGLGVYWALVVRLKVSDCQRRPSYGR